MTDRLRCLAIRQPWAWAVCSGAKDVENRTWTTEHRGPLAIQASAAKQDVNALVKKSNGKLSADDMPCGAIIGLADLVDIVPLSESLENNPWATGPYCWQFANGRLMDEPIAYKGALHLYELSDTVSRDIHNQLSRKPQIRPTSAEAWLTAMQSDPLETQILRSQSYAGLRDFSGIVRVGCEMIRLDPDSGEGYRVRGAGHFYGGDATASIPDFIDAAKRNPRDADAHFLLASAYQATGNESQAAEHWKQARELDPEVPELG